MFGGLNEYSYTQLLDPRWIHHKCSVRTCYYFLGLETLSVVFRVFCWPSPVFGKLVPPSRASGGVLPLRYPWWPCSGPQEGPPGGLQALAFACLFPCPLPGCSSGPQPQVRSHPSEGVVPAFTCGTMWRVSRGHPDFPAVTTVRVCSGAACLAPSSAVPSSFSFSHVVVVFPSFRHLSVTESLVFSGFNC